MGKIHMSINMGTDCDEISGKWKYIISKSYTSINNTKEVENILDSNFKVLEDSGYIYDTESDALGIGEIAFKNKFES